MKSVAFDKGSTNHKWWPDWQGECAAIVASGASVKGLDLSVLKDRIHVVAVKSSVDLCPWAEICYGCDAPWWIDRKGLPNFAGLKLYNGVQANHFKNLHRVVIEMNQDAILLDEPLKIGNGGNSGFQAMNLVAQFGVDNIILIGFDCKGEGNNLHWYGRNKWQNANNPQQSNFNRWMKGYASISKQLKKLGIDVVNCSMDSAIPSFRKAGLNETMKEWGL